MATLQRLFYVSRVAGDGAAVDIQRILGRSRMRNRRLDITGMLAWSGRHFAQVLEGAVPAVEQLVAEVARDPRHTDFTIVLRKPIVARDYGEWEMGYIEGFGASERIEALIGAPPPAGLVDLAEIERFVTRLFAPAF